MVIVQLLLDREQRKWHALLKGNVDAHAGSRKRMDSIKRHSEVVGHVVRHSAES